MGSRLIAGVLLAVLATASCGYDNSEAGTLAALDTHAGAADDAAAQPYHQALDVLVPSCTQDEDEIGLMADKSATDLAAHGITESRLDVLHHLRDSIPAGTPRTDCQQILAAYLALRE